MGFSEIFQSARWIDFIKNVIGHHGNTPGFPNQFKYFPSGHFPEETIPDNLNIYPEHNYPIPRENREGMPPYNLMVTDVPFDYVNHQKNAALMSMAGFGALLVGLAILS